MEMPRLIKTLNLECHTAALLGLSRAESNLSVSQQRPVLHGEANARHALSRWCDTCDTFLLKVWKASNWATLTVAKTSIVSTVDMFHLKP